MLTFAFLFLGGCEAKAPELGDSGTTETTPVDTSMPSVKPEVTSTPTADCAPNVDGLETWAVRVDVSDPQDDIAAVGSTVAVIDGDGATLATYALACAPTTCSGTWQSDDDGVDCSVGGSSTFRFVIVDEQGNSSDPYDFDPS